MALTVARDNAVAEEIHDNEQEEPQHDSSFEAVGAVLPDTEELDGQVNLRGTISNIRMHNADNGYTVCEVFAKGDHYGSHNMVGNFVGAYIGAEFDATCVTSEHPKFGKQFKVITFKIVPPVTGIGIQRYLASITPKVGQVSARAIYETFGKNSLKIISESPERLSEVPGLHDGQISSLVESVKKNKAYEEGGVFLRESGLTEGQVNRVFKHFGWTSLKKRLQDNPWELIKVSGITLATADKVGRKVGYTVDSFKRLTAGLMAAMRYAESGGHTGAPKEWLTTEAVRLLNLGGYPSAVNWQSVKDALELNIEQKTFITETAANGKEYLFDINMMIREATLSLSLLKAAKGEEKDDFYDKAKPFIQREMEFFEKKNGYKLDESQKNAIHAAFQSPVMALTGGPGCGKTTISQVIYAVYERMGYSVGGATIAGKAAQRMNDVFDRAIAMTFCRHLMFKSDSAQEESNVSTVLPYDVLFLDEMSMPAIVDMFNLMNAIRSTTRVLMIGDVDQIPSIGAGKVFADVLNAGSIPSVRLNTQHRSASAIERAAFDFNRGVLPQRQYLNEDGEVDTSYKFLPVKDAPQDIITGLKNVYQGALNQGHKLMDIVVLVPMRVGPLGTIELNKVIQNMVNPTPKSKIFFGKGNEESYGLGDKVMQIANNYTKDIMNGSVGIIVDIDPSGKSCVVDFGRNRFVTLEKGELIDTTLAYVSTVHKYQGSQESVVLLIASMFHKNMLKRNLFFTGMTRGEEHLRIIGSETAFQFAMDNLDDRRRVTLMEDYLKNPEKLSKFMLDYAKEIKLFMSMHVKGNGLDTSFVNKNNEQKGKTESDKFGFGWLDDIPF